MTTFEMQQLFEELLQTSNPLFNDSEKPDTDTIFRYLNLAQVEYIQKKYLSAPTFYERTQVIGANMNDLKNLIVTLDFLNSPTPPYTNSIVLIPDTLAVWHYLSLSGVITRTYPYTTTSSLIDFTPIEAENLNQYLTTSINKPIILVPVYTHTKRGIPNVLGDQSGILVIHDSYTTLTPTSTKAQVMTYPRLLVLEVEVGASTTQTDICDIATYLHEDIVKMAVLLYESQKYKLISKEAK